MKKIAMLLMVALASSSSRAFEDLRSTPSQSIYGCRNNDCFLDVPDQWDDECNLIHEESQQQDIDEYDQNVSDNVQPPKISPAQEMFAKVLGSILIRYIRMREMARMYCKEVKALVAQWYSSIVNAL